MGGCAAGSSTAPPCASLPALDTFRPSRREHQDWSLLPSSPKASERPTWGFRALRDLEQRAQIKRISLAENSSREIQESGINPDKTSLNSISSFGSRSEQISASREPLFLDTTLCLKEPAQETMITQGQESCLHTPVWGVEGFNISTSKEVEGELTTGKQLTRVFNGLLEENTTEDTAMTTTINFDDLLLEETVFVSTSIAPMDMIEEEENLMIENTVPLSEDTTNIMEMIENAAFDLTLPEPLPTTTLHVTEHKAEVEQMVEAETFSTWTSLDDANLGLCLPAIEAEGRIELPVSVVGNNVESSEADDLLKWIMDDNQIADFNFPNEVEEATISFLFEGVKVEMVKEEMGEATKANKRSRVKMEELTEEEKYRRMREQNNRASQACRAKRKRKLAEEEQELTTLQEKNIHLQAVFKSMQEEVKTKPFRYFISSHFLSTSSHRKNMF